jgi:hypothetical protein
MEMNEHISYYLFCLQPWESVSTSVQTQQRVSMEGIEEVIESKPYGIEVSSRRRHCSWLPLEGEKILQKSRSLSSTDPYTNIKPISRFSAPADVTCHVSTYAPFLNPAQLMIASHLHDPTSDHDLDFN